MPTELLCCGEALSTVNLSNLRISHHKFQGLGEFTFAASDAEAESKSVSARDLTEPKPKNNKRAGSRASCPGNMPGPKSGCSYRWDFVHQVGSTENRVICTKQGRRDHLTHCIKGNSRLLHKIHIEESAQILCISWKFFICPVDKFSLYLNSAIFLFLKKNKIFEIKRQGEVHHITTELHTCCSHRFLRSRLRNKDEDLNSSRIWALPCWHTLLW